MIILAVTEAVWLALIAACLAAFLEWMRRGQKAIKNKVDEIHELSNGQMGETLKIGMISAQALAHSTGQDDHQQLAKAATDKYESHLALEQKVIVDKQNK